MNVENKKKTFCKDDGTPLFCFHDDDKNSTLKLWKKSQMDRHFSQQQQKFSHDQTQSQHTVWIFNQNLVE